MTLLEICDFVVVKLMCILRFTMARPVHESQISKEKGKTEDKIDFSSNNLKHSYRLQISIQKYNDYTYEGRAGWGGQGR